MENENLGKKNGFSLLEVIFAIGIVTVGIVTVMTLFIQNMKNEITSKNKLIAIYLAQESIEAVKQIRDNNWFNGNTWLNGIPTGSDVVIAFANRNDIRKGYKVVNVNGDGSNRIIYSSNDVSYIQIEDNSPNVGWEQTGFERYLRITVNTGDNINGCIENTEENCAEIISRVSFNGSQIAEARAYIYNWYFVQ